MSDVVFNEKFIAMLRTRGAELLHSARREHEDKYELLPPWKELSPEKQIEKQALFNRFLDLATKETRDTPEYGFSVTKEEREKHERCRSGEFGEFETYPAEPGYGNLFYPEQRCSRCRGDAIARWKAEIESGAKKRRYCWMIGAVVQLSDDEKCDECCQIGSKHRAIDNQALCGYYVPISDGEGVGCVLEAHHRGPHSNGGTPYVCKARWGA